MYVPSLFSQASDSDMKSKWLAALVDTDAWQAARDASKQALDGSKLELQRLRDRVAHDTQQVEQLKRRLAAADQEEQEWHKEMEQHRVRG
jgi:chromosome segregation ATPase